MQQDIRQAGAIVFKPADAEMAFLLVRAKKNPTHWIFPKGHIEAGETAEAASVRELREEAGIEGQPVRYVGERSFDCNGLRYNVAYFLVEYRTTVGPGESGRDPCWCPIDEALSLLTFPDMRDLLRKSAAFFPAA